MSILERLGADLYAEPQSITAWAELARRHGGRLNVGRNHWETSVTYREGLRWDELLEAWVSA